MQFLNTPYLTASNETYLTASNETNRRKIMTLHHTLLKYNNIYILSLLSYLNSNTQLYP